MKYKKKLPYWEYKQINSPYDKLVLNIPKNIFEEIKTISYERDIPYSTLILIALYKEVNSRSPDKFTLPDAKLPDEDMTNVFKYVTSANKLRYFLDAFKYGLTVEQLVMFAGYLDMSKEEMLNALKTLLDHGLANIRKFHKSRVAGTSERIGLKSRAKPTTVERQLYKKKLNYKE